MVDISNKLAYTFILFGIIVAVAVGVNAYGTTNPPVMGHTLGELNVGANCGDGQVLKSIGSGSYTCINTQAAILNGMSQCAGANQSIKTINWSSGVVTCEPDDFGASGGSGLTAPGATVNYISKFTGASTLGNSQIQDTGDNIFIGSTSMPEAFWSDKMRIVGGVDIVAPSAADNWDLYYRLNNKAALSYFSTAANDGLDINRDWTSAQGFHSDFSRVTLWGPVGIGTLTPQDYLHIAGSVGFTSILLEKTGATPNRWHFGTGATGFNFAESGVADYRLFLMDGGNVGINTNNPTEKLHISGSGDIKAVVESTGSHAGIRLKSVADSWMLQEESSNKRFRVYQETGASPGEKFTILPGGNVGIGTNSPTEKLDVAGGVKGTYLCMGADCRSGWQPAQCPPRRVMVNEISAGWDEWITYANCLPDVLSVIISTPQICDNGTCRYISNSAGVESNADLACIEFGFAKGFRLNSLPANLDMCVRNNPVDWRCNELSSSYINQLRCYITPP